MHSPSHRSLSKLLAVALVFVAACDNQVTPTEARTRPADALHADKAPFKNVFALEPLPGSGGSYSLAAGINDLGQIVGSSSSPLATRGVIWDNSSVPIDLGGVDPTLSTSADAISADGLVIAGTAFEAGGDIRPVRWLKTNGQWVFDALPQGGGASCSIGGMSPNGAAIGVNCNISFSNLTANVWLNGSRIVLGEGYVNGVNGKGQAVGVNSTYNRALLWTFGSGAVTVTDLGTLGGSYAAAMSINEAGEVTGWSENANHESHAFLWSPKKNSMTDLGLAGTTSGGYGINATGQVVGDLWLNTTRHAGFFDHGKVVDLGVLPGYEGGLATRLNNKGMAVGYSYNVSSICCTRATVWVLK